MSRYNFGAWAGTAFFKLLLRSPLHGMMSRSTLLLTVAGRKTGRPITLPVNYLRQENTLTITSMRDRTWWRNLRGGTAVTLRLQGEDVAGEGMVIEEESAVAEGLGGYLRRLPGLARYYNVAIDGASTPRPEDLEREAKRRVIVKVELQSPLSP